jgi:hypothetical protein
MTHSESLRQLTVALLRFHREVEPIATNAEGERTAYADLHQLREDTRGLLADCGLIVVQSGGYDVIETTILHRSGEWMTLLATCARSASGEVAYGARHAYMLALGLTELPPVSGASPGTRYDDASQLSPDEIVERNRQQKRRSIP